MKFLLACIIGTAMMEAVVVLPLMFGDKLFPKVPPEPLLLTLTIGVAIYFAWVISWAVVFIWTLIRLGNKADRLYRP